MNEKTNIVSKYRLIKKEAVNNLGEMECEFIIQKKFLWWWVTANLLCHYNTYNYRAMLITRRYTFSSEKMAKAIFEKLTSPLLFRYKGNTIQRVFVDHTLEDVYINWSNYTIWRKRDGNDACYEYSYSLDELKTNIDRRIIKTSIKVIN